MDDEQIERLGDYFIALNIRERYSITFERFVAMVLNDTWKEVVNVA